MNVEGKYIWDPDHDLILDGDFHQTERGWSDVKSGQSAGERSVQDNEKQIVSIFKPPVKLVSQRRLPIILGHLSEKQKALLDKLEPEEVADLYRFCKSAMRVDFAIMPKEPEDLFPIYIEIDGSQHEQDGEYRGHSKSHLDRVKDFCSRLNDGAVMVRVKSNENSGRNVLEVLSRMERFRRLDLETGDYNLRRERCQFYVCEFSYFF